MLEPFRRFALSDGNGEVPLGPLRPVFVCAVIFGGLIRLMEIYVVASSTADGMVEVWLGLNVTGISAIGAAKWVSAAFVLTSFLEMVTSPKHTGCRASFVFCLGLSAYCFGMGYLLHEYSQMLEAIRYFSR